MPPNTVVDVLKSFLPLPSLMLLILLSPFPPVRHAVSVLGGMLKRERPSRHLTRQMALSDLLSAGEQL